MLEQRATVYLTVKAYGHTHAQQINAVDMSKTRDEGPCLGMPACWQSVASKRRDHLWQQRTIAADSAQC